MRAFFGALFYARHFAVPWLGGEGDKGITGEYLWPNFSPTWPVVQNPDPAIFPGPHESMAAPSIARWVDYLPFWNTVILLSSSVTVHFAHSAVKEGKRGALKFWLLITVAMGVLFLVLQGYEYHHAYTELGLTLGSGIYGSTFFILTGFHGFHVTLGRIHLVDAAVPRDAWAFQAGRPVRPRGGVVVLALRRRGVGMPVFLRLRALTRRLLTAEPGRV